MQETIPDLQAHCTDLFTMPSQEISMLSGRTTVYHPLNRTLDEGPFTFQIDSQGMDYVHMAATRMFLSLKITNADGTNIGANANVAPVNLPGNSIWKSIDIDIGGSPATELGNFHANIKSYLETTLSYSKPAITSHLRGSIFTMDTSGKFEDFLPEAFEVEAAAGPPIVARVVGHIPNYGFQERKRLFAESKSVHIMTPVHCDFMQSDKFLPPGVKLTVTFNRAPDSWVLMSNDVNANYKLVVQDLKLYIRHVKIADGIIKQHMLSFQKQPAIYHINKTLIKTFTYPTGLPEVNVANMFTGVLPKTVIIAMCKATAFAGSYGTNPFHYEHFGLTSGMLRVNGDQVPSEPYRPQWATNNFAYAYRDLFDNIGIGHSDQGNILTPDLFKGGVFLMSFDLTPDRCAGRHYHPRQSGVIGLELAFAPALAQPIVIIAFATYDAIVLLDKNNKITTDISV